MIKAIIFLHRFADNYFINHILISLEKLKNISGDENCLKNLTRVLVRAFFLQTSTSL